MKSIIERLTPVPDYSDETRMVYLETNIREIAPIVIPLLPYHPPIVLEPYRDRSPGGLLAAIEDGAHVEFAVFEWNCGPAADTAGAQVEPSRYSLVFQGSGAAGAALRARE